MPISRRLRNVNMLYLLSMVLILTAGSAMQSRSVGWGLIGTELFLILLPALVYVFKIDPAAKHNLRWRWPGGRYVLAGILIGAGLQFATVFLHGLAAVIFGYVVGVPPEFYPADGGHAVLLFVAMAILAPLCEELLFRGVIQPAYEACSPRLAIVAVGLMFAFIHMRLQGLLPLLPIAFALGYIVYRGDSLFLGIAAHLSFNTVSVLTNFTFTRTPDFWPLIVVTTVVGGLISLVVGLKLLPPRHDKAAGRGAADGGYAKPAVGKLAVGWSLAVAFLLYGLMAGVEYMTFGNVEAATYPDAQLLPAGDIVPVTLLYEVQDPLGQRIGTATYTVELQSDLVQLSWVVQHEAFRTELGKRSVYMSGAVDASGMAHWDAATGQLVFVQARSNEMEWRLTTSYGTSWVAVEPSDGELFPPLAVPDNVLVTYEWPWRLAGLPFTVGYRATVTLYWPMKWDAVTQDNIPLLESTSVKVMGSVPVHTPAGRFIVWEVRLGERQTVWYDIHWPHHVVRYDDGLVSYVLAAM